MGLKSNLPKGRYMVLLWVGTYFYLPGFQSFYFRYFSESAWYWWDIVYYYYFYAFVVIGMGLLVYFSKVSWKTMFSPFDSQEMKPAVKLTAFIFLFSMAAMYLLFYPLSYVVPDFVTWWLIDLPPFIYEVENSYPFIPNLLSFLTLVVLAPVIEEFMFRGLLLHRWTQKWGLYKAVLFSSLLFGVMHPDVIGAFAFGIAMCVLYLKTQTLWVPILCHALTNFAVWLIDVGYRMALGDEYSDYSLEQFQDELYIGVACGVIVLFWFNSYMKTPQKKLGWKLPSL